MRVLFWGTPDFAVPSLRALLGEGHDVVGVVTRPDRPAGRGRTLRSSAVKEVALQEGLVVLEPSRPGEESFVERLRSLAPEISVVAAYGHILPATLLELPRLGSINVHASLLPELRGAAPVHWAIARGHAETGVTIMRMTEGMDEGPILLQREIPVGPEDTSSGLTQALAELGAEALVEALGLIEIGGVEAREQDPSRATYAPKVGRDVAKIDWSRAAIAVANHIRAMDRVPGAWTTLGGVEVKCFHPRPTVVTDREASIPTPGCVIGIDPESGIVVRTGEGAVAIGEVQPAGGRRMEALAWGRGRGLSVGSRFE